MAKHKTDNEELVYFDDVDIDAFYPDYVENLNKINDGDRHARPLTPIDRTTSTMRSLPASKQMPITPP